jgi:hypothetical protein
VIVLGFCKCLTENCELADNCFRKSYTNGSEYQYYDDFDKFKKDKKCEMFIDKMNRVITNVKKVY